jgi:hypothetical protein
MFYQVRLKIQKHQSRSQMCLTLKNVCETQWCLIVDRWSNDESDNMIVIFVAADSLIVDHQIMQYDVSTHDEPESALRVRPVRDG